MKWIKRGSRPCSAHRSCKPKLEKGSSRCCWVTIQYKHHRMDPNSVSTSSVKWRFRIQTQGKGNMVDMAIWDAHVGIDVSAYIGQVFFSCCSVPECSNACLILKMVALCLSQSSHKPVLKSQQLHTFESRHLFELTYLGCLNYFPKWGFPNPVLISLLLSF